MNRTYIGLPANRCMQAATLSEPCHVAHVPFEIGVGHQPAQAPADGLWKHPGSDRHRRYNITVCMPTTEQPNYSHGVCPCDLGSLFRSHPWHALNWGAYASVTSPHLPVCNWNVNHACMAVGLALQHLHKAECRQLPAGRLLVPCHLQLWRILLHGMQPLHPPQPFACTGPPLTAAALVGQVQGPSMFPTFRGWGVNIVFAECLPGVADRVGVGGLPPLLCCAVLHTPDYDPCPCPSCQCISSNQPPCPQPRNSTACTSRQLFVCTPFAFTTYIPSTCNNHTTAPLTLPCAALPLLQPPTSSSCCHCSSSSSSSPPPPPLPPPVAAVLLYSPLVVVRGCGHLQPAQ